MSILASVLPGRASTGPSNQPYRPAPRGAETGKYLAPSLALDSDAAELPRFQPGGATGTHAGEGGGLSAALAQNLRFFLPMVMDSVNEVSYKISVPNFSTLPPLRLGGKYITDMIKIDSMTPGDLYGAPNLNKTSGLDNYYFDSDKARGGLSRFEKVAQTDLPDRFFEEHNTTACSTKMGLFAAVSRAWIIVDNKLLFWNYKLPQSSFNKAHQFLTIDLVRHSILAVDLVRPKKGVFVDDANFLLLIATTMEIQIFVVKHDAATNNIEIYNPKLSVNTQGLIVNRFVANEITNDIYFCGEGNGVKVWRLDYSNNASFIKNKCDKVCLTKSGISSVLPIGKILGFDLFTHEAEHGKGKPPGAGKPIATPEAIVQLEMDAARNVLYSLSNHSVIRVYKLALNQELFVQHSLLSATEIFKSLSQLIPDSANIKSFNKFRIMSIQAISQRESANILLIAVTNFGNRILFKLGASSTYSFMSAASRSSASVKLTVASMRFPPTREEPKMNPELDSYIRIKQYVAQMVANQQNSELLKNTKFSKILSPGVFLAVKKTKNSDRLFVSSVNYGFLKHNNKLIEDAEFLPVATDGGNETSPVVIHDIVQLTPSMNATETPSGYANILASQYTKKPLEFAVLTNYGISVYRYRTPDQIISSLDDKVIENFIEENGYEETCSTLLYLACSAKQKTADILLKRKAQLLFSHAGNNARLIESQSSHPTQAHASIMPSESQPMVELVVLSDRFYGTCLLISRLFRDMWSVKVFAPLPHIKTLKNGSVEVSSVKEDNLLIEGVTINKQQVEYLMGSVIVLLDFLNENRTNIPGLNAPSYSSDPSKLENEVCVRAEHIAFTSILRSLTSMKEALSFLMVLIEETQVNQNNHNDIFKFLSLTNQLNLLTLNLKDLLLPSLEVKNLIKDLLSSIINKTILKGGSIDLIASSLQGRCGSFCSSDDVYIFKAIENLTRAKNIGNRDNEMRLKCLRNAVTLFEQASDSLTLENIENSIDIMLSLDFYKGAVEFLLKLAKRLQGVAGTLSTVVLNTSEENNGSFAHINLEQKEKKRLQLYDLIFKILVKLDVKAIQVNSSNNQLMINEFMELRDLTYDTCFASPDKSFQYEFYRWFIRQGCSERLLTVNTPFILPFLEEVSQDDLSLTELLWLYHAKREEYYPAARILYFLAISNFKLPLRQRIEYLTRASGFCNCTCPPSLRQNIIQLSTLINELFEVANVQLDLLTMIQADPRVSVENREHATNCLDNKIQKASELFNEYADPLGYYEICFRIFYVSDYKNPDDIFKRWELYFERLNYEYTEKKDKSKPFCLVLSDALVSVGSKIHNNDFVFPVDKLIKLMCKYIQAAAEEDESSQKPPLGVVIDTFRRAGVAYETLHVTLKTLIEYNSHDMYAGFTKFLKENEMLYLLQSWYRSDKRLREAIPEEAIVTMAEYTTASDPVAKWVKTQGVFI
ncbi:nucleoporin-domain-containing protein [Metschnikowia bicuspidata var. bicuspidata NRRL YB-4993]|uniref:Nucleoporin-domain-containing protein n=1 Tax=Metschnikowia bicuspidata var. bicuspidata NRRL YB-4993 TaxID=869754 RepID=A0A1A0HAP1_9ASCO|nr:nucleoporin-domain-containing protein [Metschnikowia bicuspidata var. bicuspidata NRRL YB-4993]OBA20947.1 nucleoporin-domain-containing protein [Metschnikowia bicuspidata var. bicuspidata NRRL YB-4993]